MWYAFSKADGFIVGAKTKYELIKKISVVKVKRLRTGAYKAMKTSGDSDAYFLYSSKESAEQDGWISKVEGGL